MAYKLQLKRGASGSLPTGIAGEPLFTTDTNDLYIGTGASNQRYQKYIASGTSSQFLKGDGSLDSNTYYLASNPSAYIALTALTASSPLSYNNTTGAFTIAQASGSVSGFLSSTDWTTFNNKQNTITNPVTGTGTTNYLPKWTSGTALGNSLVYDDGTNIGIGNSSPSVKLDVTGNISSSATIKAITSLVVERDASDTIGSGSYLALVKSSNAYQSIFQLNSTAGITLWSYDGSWKSAFVTNGATGATTFSSSVTATSFNGTTNNIFSVSGTEGMRLTSTGLGIGTTSPQNKLHVEVSNEYARISNPSNGSGGIKISYQNSDTHGLHLTYNTGSAVSYIDNTYPVSSGQVYGDIYFRQNVGGTMTNRMVIKADGGNLGLGVVPSAWSGKSMQIVNSSLTDVASSLQLSYNGYFDGTNWRYITSAAATNYYQTDGAHYWRIAPSGTAGNAISFTQAMTLDASGRLGIGVTSMSSYNAGGNQFVIGGGEFRGLTIAATTEGNIYFADGTTGADTYRGTIGYNHTSNYLYFFTDGSERLRITSGGDVLINTTDDAGDYKLQINGNAYFGSSTYSNGTILYLRDAFATGSNTSFAGMLLGSSPGTDFVLGKQSTNTVGSFAIKTGGGTTLMTLSDAGAATFSGSVDIGNSVAVGVAVASTHKVSIMIGGVQYYLLASNV
jgi:hypothetical protein